MEDLDQKQFTRERVKNRMLKRAAELWGYPESQMDEFDPLVRLLIEACAVEFERTAGEIGKTQNRMLERLAQLLYPGEIDIRPAAAIMQARPAEAAETLFPEDQFFCKSGIDRNNSDRPAELFFSPLRPVRLCDAAVVIQATTRELYRIDPEQKSVIASAGKKSVPHQHSVWLGLETGEELKTLGGLNIFFQWQQPGDNEHWLPLTEWRVEDVLMTPVAGMPAYEAADPRTGMESAFDGVQQLQNLIGASFDKQFLHFAVSGSPDIKNLKRRRYPEVFESLYTKKDLQELKEPLLWIEICFPSLVTAEALDSVSISINAFPVINRKLNRVHFKLGQRLNILPLETSASFLAIKEIINSDGDPVRMIPFADTADLPPETYTLRYGVNRFDERNAYEVLINLTDLIREESSYFSSLGEDFLSQHIRELNQVLARIESRLGSREKKASPYPYLAVRPQGEGGSIQVEFWSCDGAAANRIAARTRLIPYQNSSLQTDSLMLLTGSAGGRDKFTDREKIDQYKMRLLTRDRIVTLEDLRQFVRAEVGTNARDLQFRFGFIVGAGSGEGFIRCMEIRIDPEPGQMQQEEWQQFIAVLQTKLEKASASHLPYRITLTGSGKF